MWYSANIIFQSTGHSGKEDLCEERIVIFDAPDEENALSQAEKYGRENEHEYVSGENGTIRWNFSFVDRVYEIDADELTPGAELFSRFLKKSEVDLLQEPIDLE